MAKINITIIERNIIGNASGEEQKILHSWLCTDKSNRDAYFRMKNIWDSCRIKGYSQDTIRREWELLANRIKTVEIKHRHPVNRRKKIFLQPWLRYAAIFIIASAITWGISRLGHIPGKTDPLQAVYQQIIVPNGQRTQVELSDGTKVWLNAGTTLRYPMDFGVNNRQVMLEGEAGFEVTTTGLPFTVTAGKMRITVLGTHFNVRNYATENYVETSLFEGSVVINDSREELILKPGQIAVYRKDRGQTTVQSDPEIESKSAWNNHQLIIKGERLGYIAQTLERWYDVKITITDDYLKEQRYTGKFVYNENIGQVMKVISATTPIRYEINGRQVTIFKK